MDEWIWTGIKILGGIAAGLGGYRLWLVRAQARKTDAEAQHISTVDEISLRDMEQKAGKSFFELFEKVMARLEAATEKMNAMQDEMIELKEDLSAAQRFIRRMVEDAKENRYEGWEQMEQDAATILNRKKK